MSFVNVDGDGNVHMVAPVLVPGAKDCDYDCGEKPLTREQVKDFMESYQKYGFVDNEHSLTFDGKKVGYPGHGWLTDHTTDLMTRDGLKTYPAGTWLQETIITDSSLKNKALNGDVVGYSATFRNRASADQFNEVLKSTDTSRRLVSSGNKLICELDDPVVLSISLANNPCLSDSRIVDLSKDGVSLMTETNNIVDLKDRVIDSINNVFKSCRKDEPVPGACSSNVEDNTTDDEFVLKTRKELNVLTESLRESLERLKLVEDEIAALKTEVVSETVCEEESVEEVDETVETVEESEETVVEESVPEDDTVAKSRADPVHDNVDTVHTKLFNLYERLGRNSDGTRKQ